jgi:hypothetical protein
MYRLDMTSGKAVWTEPDLVAISVPTAKATSTLRHFLKSGKSLKTGSP